MSASGPNPTTSTRPDRATQAPQGKNRAMKIASPALLVPSLVLASLALASPARAQNGLIVGQDGENTFYLYDDGAWTALGFGANTVGMAGDNATCTLYIANIFQGVSSIYTLRPGQLQAEFLVNVLHDFGGGDLGGISISGLAFNPITNKLIASRTVTGSGPAEGFYEINTTTGVVTQLYAIPSAQTSNYDFGGIDCDPATGTLYGTSDPQLGGTAFVGVYRLNVPPGAGQTALQFLTAYPASINDFPGSGSGTPSDVDGLAAGDGHLWLTPDEAGAIKPYSLAGPGPYQAAFTNPFQTVGSLSSGAAFLPCFANPAPTCDSIDFNGDGVTPDLQDVVDFFLVFGGGDCPTGTCNDTDFNNDGVFPDIQDVVKYLEVFGGGVC
jgi:hypothetical protein